MSQLATSAEIQLPDSWAAKRCRELEQAGRGMLSQVMSSPLISPEQREAAEQRAERCTDLRQLLTWYDAVKEYIRAVTAGERPARTTTVAAEAIAAEQPLAQEPVTLDEPELAPVPAATMAPVRKMKQQYRPARRIPAERLERLRASNQAKREAFEMKRTAAPMEARIIPMWETAPQLTALPGGLHWSGQGEVPGVGQAVQVQRHGVTFTAQVTGYFHAEGSLGLVGELVKAPAKIQRALRSQCIFGRELARVA